MRRAITVLAALALLVAACGDDDTADTPAPTEATAAETTEAPDTTAATTEAPTTTEAPATTEPAPHAGPVGAVWPDEGSTALYEGTTWGGATLDVPLHWESGYDFMGEPWTAFFLGDPENDDNALVVYMDVSEPGIIVFKGMDGHMEGLPEGQVQREWYEDPLVIDLFALFTGPIRHEAPFFLSWDTEGSDPFSSDMWVEIELVSTDASIDTPFGPVEGCFAIEFIAGGPYIGGDATADFQLFLHPEHLFVFINHMPVFRDLFLKESWG